MSYDLYLYRTPPGHDPNQYFEECMEEMDRDGGAGMNDPVLAAFADEVQEALGDLATCDFGDGMVEIHVSYAISSAQVDGVFKRLYPHLQRACSDLGLTVYDPQEGRALDPKRDLKIATRGHARGTNIVRDINADLHAQPASVTAKPARSQHVAPKKPWWKFW